MAKSFRLLLIVASAIVGHAAKGQNATELEAEAVDEKNFADQRAAAAVADLREHLAVMRRSEAPEAIAGMIGTSVAAAYAEERARLKQNITALKSQLGGSNRSYTSLNVTDASELKATLTSLETSMHLLDLEQGKAVWSRFGREKDAERQKVKALRGAADKALDDMLAAAKHLEHARHAAGKHEGFYEGHFNADEQATQELRAHKERAEDLLKDTVGNVYEQVAERLKHNPVEPSSSFERERNWLEKEERLWLGDYHKEEHRHDERRREAAHQLSRWDMERAKKLERSAEQLSNDSSNAIANLSMFASDMKDTLANDSRASELASRIIDRAKQLVGKSSMDEQDAAVRRVCVRARSAAEQRLQHLVDTSSEAAKIMMEAAARRSKGEQELVGMVADDRRLQIAELEMECKGYINLVFGRVSDIVEMRIAELHAVKALGLFAYLGNYEGFSYVAFGSFVFAGLLTSLLVQRRFGVAGSWHPSRRFIWQHSKLSFAQKPLLV